MATKPTSIHEAESKGSKRTGSLVLLGKKTGKSGFFFSLGKRFYGFSALFKIIIQKPLVKEIASILKTNNSQQR